jgi:hypothetical protein
MMVLRDDNRRLQASRPMMRDETTELAAPVIISAIKWCTPTVARTRGGLQMLQGGVTLSKGMRQERGVVWISSVFVTG